MVWRRKDPEGNESQKIRYEIVPYTAGLVLDLGCGSETAFPHFIGVDNYHHADKMGMTVKAKVLDVDVEKERISLGVKQLKDDPAAAVLDSVRKGEIVTCIVTAIQANGIEVKVGDVLTGFIRRAEIGRAHV